MPVRFEPTSTVYTNQLYREVSTDRLYRVVETAHGQSETFLVRLNISRLEIRILDTLEFRGLVEESSSDPGRFERVIADPYSERNMYRRARSNGDPASSAADLKDDDNWELVQPLVKPKEDDQRQAFRQLLRNPHYRAAAVRAVGEIYVRTHEAERHEDRDSSEGCDSRQSGRGERLRKRIYQLLRLYLQRGMREDSVRSGYANCGSATGDRICRPQETPKFKKRTYKQRPGRQPRSTQHSGALPSVLLDRLFERYCDYYETYREGPWDKVVPESMMKAIRSKLSSGRVKRATSRKVSKEVKQLRRAQRNGAKSSARRRGRPTQQDIVDHCNYTLRATKEVYDSDGHLIELELSPNNYVTARQFQHYWLTQRSPASHKRHALGPREFELRGMPARGHATQHIKGPGSAFLIDATIADLYLLSLLARHIVVGRPTVYLVMDMWSRAIVGVHVTFDPPSFEGAALCLESVVTPKVQLCRRWGLRIEEHQWPCDQMGDLLFADRGSDYLAERRWEIVCNSLQIGIKTSPPWKAPARGLVERRFGNVMSGWQKATFGVVQQDASTRGAPRYSIEACHTRPEFMNMLLRAILIYNRTPIRGDSAVPGMTFHQGRGLPNTPIDRWTWGINEGSGCLHSVSVDDVRAATWPESEALITSKGLRWADHYYTSGIVVGSLAYRHGKDNKGHVPIQFNPDDLNQIIFNGKGYTESAVWAPTNEIVLPEACTLMESNMFIERTRRLDRDALEAEESQRIMASENARFDAQRAKDLRDEALASRGMSRPDDSHLREARAREREFGKFARGARSRSKDGAPPVQDAQAAAPEPAQRPVDLKARSRARWRDLTGASTHGHQEDES